MQYIVICTRICSWSQSQILFQMTLYQGLWLSLRWMYLLQFEFDTTCLNVATQDSHLPLRNPGLVLKGQTELSLPSILQKWLGRGRRLWGDTREGTVLKDFAILIFLIWAHDTELDEATKRTVHPSGDDQGWTKGDFLFGGAALKAIWEIQMFMFYWTLTLSLLITTFLYILSLFT